jgi:hypothetical protein
MKNIRANQKAFAITLCTFFGSFIFFKTWEETSILLKVLDLMFIIGLYFFILLGLRHSTERFKNIEWLKKYSVTGYILEYFYKSAFICVYLTIFALFHIVIVQRSDHVTDVYKSKCYKVGNFDSCYNYFQIMVSEKLDNETKEAFKFTLNKCNEGQEKFCSHYVRMVDSHPNFVKNYKTEALDAALKYKMILTNKALLTEEYTMALAMNNKFNEAIKLQKKLIEYAKSTDVPIYQIQNYEAKLKQWESQRVPASKK